MSDPMPAPTMPFWKDPAFGKFGHGAITFAGGLALVLLPILIDNLNGPQPLITASETTLVIITAALNYVYSQLRNAGAVTISTIGGELVKAAQDSGAATVMARAKDVLPTTENVIVLRGTGDPAPTPARFDRHA